MKTFTLNLQSIIFYFCIPLFGFSQTQEELRSKHYETLDDPYISVDKAAMSRSPAYSFKSSTVFTTQVNVDSDGMNIVGDAGNEPSIAVDPTNPNRMIIGWRQFDTVNSNFRQAGYGYSLDGGLTWTFPGVIEPGVFRSDPVLDFDSAGNIYYNSLTTPFSCVVFPIPAGTVVPGMKVPANGGDKQWMRIDRTGGPSDGNNYEYWNSNFTSCDPTESFTRSTDGSQSFNDCVAIAGDPFWGTLAVGANGTLFIVGNSDAGPIVVASSSAQNPSDPVNWDFVTSVFLDGEITAGAAVNPQGLLGQAWIDIDISGGPGSGNIYVVSSVARNNGDPGDVMFARSTDEGLSFEPPIRINTDSGTTATQWFGTMAVAPNGRIDVIWLDTKNAPSGTLDSALYYSFSEDQGDTWSVNERISEAFDPTIGYPQQNKMGDYFDMVSENSGVHLAWTNTLNGGQDVYYSYIIPEAVLGVEEVGFEEFMVYPNPVSENTVISFSSSDWINASLEVFDISGKKVASLYNELAKGTTKINWNGVNKEGEKLNSGLYFLSLKNSKSEKVIKILIN